MEKVVVDNESIRGYFINSLADGRDDFLDILFLSQKKYWELISRIPEFYPNINVETSYYDAIEYEDVEFFNINILKSDEEFNKKNYNLLEELSTCYLKDHYNDFIIGYSFHNEDKEEALIISCNKGNITEERFVFPKNVPSAIINLTIKKYDEIKNTLQLMRVK